MGKVNVVVGMQYGDEGKGKLVDFYSRYGFDQYSTKGNGYVEMFRDRVSDRV